MKFICQNIYNKGYNNLIYDIEAQYKDITNKCIIDTTKKI